MRFPCPCCGHLTMYDPPGCYDICKVCFWEDDYVQLRWPDWPGGANSPSLIEAQHHYQRDGVMELRFLSNVRPALPDEPVDDGWRPVDLALDSFELCSVQESPWPSDRTTLYWWRPTFWRRDLTPSGARVPDS